jgi:uncharacterized protein with HEPN domain
VERQFEILGEALKRIRDKDEEFLEMSITGWRGAISFRNICEDVPRAVTSPAMPAFPPP